MNNTQLSKTIYSYATSKNYEGAIMMTDEWGAGKAYETTIMLTLSTGVGDQHIDSSSPLFDYYRGLLAV